jgi:hypothetical protein
MITNIERKRYIWHKILMPNIISKTSSIMNKFLYATWAEKITLAYYKNSNITHNKIKQHWALIYKFLLNAHYHQNVVQSICFLSKVTILINNNTKLSKINMMPNKIEKHRLKLTNCWTQPELEKHSSFLNIRHENFN